MNRPLAIDQNGETFDVPEEATAWRVRRFSKSGKGTPETIYHDGARLTVPIDATTEDLAEALRHAIDDDIGGKYRLDPIDEEGASMGVPGAYAQFGSSGGGGNRERAGQSDALTKALECNFRLVNSVVDALKCISTQYASAMESSAKAATLRAQHLPEGLVVDASLVPKAPSAEDEEKTQHVVDWTPLVEQLAPIVSQFGGLAAAKLASKLAAMGSETKKPN